MKNINFVREPSALIEKKRYRKLFFYGIILKYQTKNIEKKGDNHSDFLKKSTDTMEHF